MRYSGNGTLDETGWAHAALRTSPTQADEELLLSMRLAPSLQMVDAFRGFVVVYLTRRYSRQLGDKLATVCHELLENAVNHGTADADIQIEMRTTASGALEIRVLNTCTPSAVNCLHERVHQLLGTNTSELYRQALRSSTSAKSMLGLVRIRHEAGMTVEAVSEGNQVSWWRGFAPPRSGDPQDSTRAQSSVRVRMLRNAVRCHVREGSVRNTS